MYGKTHTLFTCCIFLAQKRLKKHHISEDSVRSCCSSSTTHRRSAEPRALRTIFRFLFGYTFQARRDRWRRDGGEKEARRRRAGDETQTERNWGRDADGGGGEMADAGERRGRDGGEMEARRGRDGGGDATRVAATRVARAARLATNTNPNPNQSAEPRLLAAAPNQSTQHSK